MTVTFTQGTKFATYFFHAAGRGYVTRSNRYVKTLEVLTRTAREITRLVNARELDAAYDQAVYGLVWVIESGRANSYVYHAVTSLKTRPLCQLIHELKAYEYNIGFYASYLNQKYTPQPAAPQVAEEIQEAATPAPYRIIHNYDELLKGYYESHGVQFSRDWPERTAFVFSAEHSADAVSAALACTHEYTHVEGQPALVAFYWHELEILRAINTYCWENSPQSMPEPAAAPAEPTTPTQEPEPAAAPAEPTTPAPAEEPATPAQEPEPTAPAEEPATPAPIESGPNDFIQATPEYVDINGIVHAALWKPRPIIPFKKRFKQQRWDDLPEFKPAEQPPLF